MSWQKQLIQSNISIQDLRKNFKFKEELLPDPKFPIRATEHYLRKINNSDANDPLLLQILPDLSELVTVKGYSDDINLEQTFNVIPGLIHKYKSRVLLTITGACAIHCRYCFRQNYNYKDNIFSRKRFENIRAYVLKDPSIKEVILSGGDPFTLNDEILKQVLTSLNEIPHINTIRFHTRVPIILPDRFNDSLKQILTSIDKNIVIVIHSNHGNELDQELSELVSNFSFCTFLNQSVLLKNINDKVEILSELSHKLFQYKIMPYYLHILDQVSGSQRYAVEATKIKLLYHELLSCLPGYLVPKLVQEIPNKAYKTPINAIMV